MGERDDLANWPRVEVAWWDIWREDATWIHPDNARAPALCLSRGWLIRDEADYIIVADTIPGDDDHDRTIGGVNSIPRGCVVSIQYDKPE